MRTPADLDISAEPRRVSAGPTPSRAALLVWISLASCRAGSPPQPPPSAQATPGVEERGLDAEADVAPVDEATAADHDDASTPDPPVAKVEPPWREQDLPRIAKVQPIVKAAAAQHGIDPHLVNAIIWHESKFHPKVTGRGGSAGLMQLMPSTSRALARRLGRPHRPYDVQFNVEVGTYLLARLMKKFDGDERLALAGYGLGSGRVRALLEAGQPLPDRTERFIAKVHRFRQAFAQLEAASARNG